MRLATGEWVRKSEADFQAALRESKTKAHDLVCFLSQQCVEKLLKALLEENGIAVPRTHDLRFLARTVVPLCPSLSPYLLALRRLSDYAVKYRYPGAWANAQQSRRAVRTAERMRKLLRAALGLK